LIYYTESLENIDESRLTGFFVDWPNPPSPETHLRLLRGSDFVGLAIESDNGNVVGFVTAHSDGVLSAYIPLLEVLPEHQHQGIGSILMKRMLEKLGMLYMVDLTCDEALVDFYSRFELSPARGMVLRNYTFQSGDMYGQKS
jgi:ribosomal protein S18 acetylase RimI-like enzyme